MYFRQFVREGAIFDGRRAISYDLSGIRRKEKKNTSVHYGPNYLLLRPKCNHQAQVKEFCFIPFKIAHSHPKHPKLTPTQVNFCSVPNLN